MTPPGKSVGFDVAVIGLGKIGLPLAAHFASRGLRVLGCDVQSTVVAAVNAGRSHIKEEPGLGEAVSSAVASGSLVATEDTTGAAKACAVVVVIVPLIVDRAGRVDFHNIDAATTAIGSGLQPGSVVIYETTLPVGTTRDRFAPALEEHSGLKVGRDLYVAFSPERLYAGRIFEDLKRYPKIVGGLDAASTRRAVDFYHRALAAEIRAVANAETAEFAKLAETTYRDVNIALANELATYGQNRNVDVKQAFDAANSQPFSHLHRPSIGVGGHCIPVYPHFLLKDATEAELDVVRLARATNDSMVSNCIEVLDHALDGLAGRKVLVLGASYRENVKELAFSTAIPLVESLRRAGASATICDPLFDPQELAGFEAEIIDLSAKGDIHVDAIVIQAYHGQFAELEWSRFRGLRIVFDGRWAVDPELIRQNGAVYAAIGIPEAAH